MYSSREILVKVQQLLAPELAAADLALLERIAPEHPHLGEFRFSPARSADAILLELLKLATVEEIVANRQPKPEPVQEPEPEPVPQPEPVQEPEPEPVQEPEPEQQPDQQPEPAPAPEDSKKK